MEQQIATVTTPSALEVLNRSEIDVQISTAKAYPRDVASALQRIEQLASFDTEIAADCFYRVQRGKDMVEGVSVRMAEIIAKEWGNLRVQARIIGNDGKTITAQGVCHDLESNYAASVEVKRRITDKLGRTYSDDMQVVTGNAASAIAFRNAVLRVVPKAVTAKIVERVKACALGVAANELNVRAPKMFAAFAKIGVSEQQIYAYLSISGRDELTSEHYMQLLGVFNAIKEGDTTVEQEFGRKNPANLAEKAAANM